MRFLIALVGFLFVFSIARAQDTLKNNVDTNKQPKLDTIATPGYVNKGKIAAKKAFHRALIFPGLGQLYNYKLIVDDVKSGARPGKQVFNKVYTLAKFAGVYAAGTLLVMSYIDNNNSYKLFLNELQYRQLNNGAPNPENGLAQYNDVSALTTAKNIFKRNREIVLISIVGVYGIAALEAYVSARLRFFNVDESLSFKIAPSTINSNTMYGFNSAPALKLTLRL